ncbi:MAG: hypothetical protein C5B46_06130, partial [Proteobacteria bacterium]
MDRLNDPSQFRPARSDTRAGTGRRGRALWVILWVFAGLLVLIVAAIAILIADANVLRAPLSRFVTNTLHRPFAIKGDLRIGLRPHLHVELNQIELGNAPWGTRPLMAKLDKATISVEILPLFRRRVVLPEVALLHPDIFLERDVDGEANWVFGNNKSDSRAAASGEAPEVQALSIQQGRMAYVDPIVKTDITLDIDTDAGGAGKQAGMHFSGQGSLRNEEFELQGRADSLLQLASGGKPYGLNVQARQGSTRASFAGTLVPFKMETVDGKVELEGKDLAKLYPMVPIPLPWTPAYHIAGHLTRQGDQYAMRDLKGRVGRSDIEGNAAIDLGKDRPLLTARIESQRLDYKDLAGALGAPPPTHGENSRTPEQRRTEEHMEDTGKVLSSKPYS